MAKESISNKENRKLVPQLEVTKDVWKKLKILSIQKEISLPEVCIEILEKFVSGKRGSNLELQEGEM